MRSWQVAVLAVLVTAMVGIAGVVGYGMWVDKRDQPTYPQSVRDAFLVNCASGGGRDSGCRCALHALEADVPLDEFTLLDRELRSGDANAIPELLEPVQRHCGITFTAGGLGATTTTAVATTTSTTRPRSVATTPTSVDHFTQRLRIRSNPDPGLWLADGDACYVELRTNGATTASAVASSIQVPSGVDEFVYDSSCNWTFDGD